jgi:hypothetical protein
MFNCQDWWQQLLQWRLQMEVTVHLDGDPTIRQEDFFASKVEGLLSRIRDLEFDNAKLVKTNEELKERVKTLATQRPSGYRPRRNRR